MTQNINPQQKQEPEFAQTPEAQEYIQKLQQGRIELSPDATSLEQEAFKQLQGLQRKLFEANTSRDGGQKQIAQLQAQAQQLSRDIDSVTGMMSAYAQMLVSAEAERRTPPAAPANVEKPKTDTAGLDETRERLAKQKADKDAEAAAKGSNGKAPTEKKPLKTKTNGKTKEQPTAAAS